MILAQATDLDTKTVIHHGIRLAWIEFCRTGGLTMPAQSKEVAA